MVYYSSHEDSTLDVDRADVLYVCIYIHIEKIYIEAHSMYVCVYVYVYMYI